MESKLINSRINSGKFNKPFRGFGWDRFKIIDFPEFRFDVLIMTVPGRRSFIINIVPVQVVSPLNFQQPRFYFVGLLLFLDS